jgi:hypothetical protein
LVEIERNIDAAAVRSVLAAHLGLRADQIAPDTMVTVRVRLQPWEDDPLLRSLHIHFGTDFTPLTHRKVHWSTLLALAPVAAGMDRMIGPALVKRFPPQSPYWNEAVASLAVLVVTWALLALATMLWMGTRPPGEEAVRVSQIEAAIHRGRW